MPSLISGFQNSLLLIHGSIVQLNTTMANSGQNIVNSIKQSTEQLKLLDRQMLTGFRNLSEQTTTVVQLMRVVGQKLDYVDQHIVAHLSDLSQKFDTLNQNFVSLQQEFSSMHHDLTEKLPSRLDSIDHELRQQRVAMEDNFRAQKEQIDANFQLILSRLNGRCVLS